ncbi:MAG TPA: hypothetical protein VMW77_00025 [Methanoregula sp.]|nr:hypothetical protein [Methanoregula sp.]
MIIHTRPSQRNENAFTGLELVILLVAVVLVIGYLGYWELSNGKTPAPEALQKQNQGMIPNAVMAMSNILMDPGGITGYPAVDGTINGVPVLFTSQNPAMLGAFELTIQPFMMTTGAIDMGHASVFWMCGNDQEKLSHVQTPTLVCPNWTITQKLNFIPLKGADQDLMLEDTEQFVLLVCPAGHVAPYQQFTMTIAPQNGEILPLTRTVPFIITPFAILG